MGENNKHTFLKYGILKGDECIEKNKLKKKKEKKQGKETAKE